MRERLIMTCQGGLNKRGLFAGTSCERCPGVGPPVFRRMIRALRDAKVGKIVRAPGSQREDFADATFCRNAAAAAEMSGAATTAEMTAGAVAPAWMISPTFSRVIPPMARMGK
jgi:hypothetical protein